MNDGKIDGQGIAYARGRFVALDEAVIPIDDRAHQFGDGIYEVVRVYDGRPFLLDYHLERFVKSADFIHLQPERSLTALRDLVSEAIDRSGLAEAQVYFQLSRGIARRNHAFPDVPSHLTLTVRPVADENFQVARKNGQKVILADDIRWRYCFVKSLNLLPNVLVKQQALDAGANDAFFLRDGVITEATSSNVFIVRHGELWTHPANEGILHGVTRRFVLEMAAELAIPVREEAFSPDALFLADEVFTTSTTVEIAPVVSVDGKPMGARALASGSVVRRLQRAYERAHASTTKGASVV